MGERVQRYINGVLSGEITACEYVKQAVNRHLRDLETGKDRGLYFDESAALFVLDFFALLKLPKGTKYSKAGDPFVLGDWQAFYLWCLYGWKRADGSRRFRKAYLEVARKNGKSTMLGGLGLKGLMSDGEEAAEIYTAATKQDQARLILDASKAIADRSESLSGRLDFYTNRGHCNSIIYPKASSMFQPLGKDSKYQDGLNPHMALVDELHAHPDGSMWEVLESALGSRRQPLQIAITTAGFDKQCFCYTEIRDYTTRVLNGEVEDDSWFGIIYTLDEGDDWQDEANWIKANPNIGLSVDIDYLRDMANKAKASPGSLNNFLVKHLNIWTTNETKFLNMVRWDEQTEVVGRSELLGKPCYVGTDMSSKKDITAVVRLFPWGEKFVLDCSMFCPADGIRERSRKDKVPYEKWAHEGWLTATPGNVVDYDVIEAEISRTYADYDVKRLGFDQWNFEALRQRIIKSADVPDDGLVQFSQSISSMTDPTKEFEALVLSGRLIHNNNPVLRWMAENTCIWEDSNQNIRPIKEKGKEGRKIDGIVAGIMALGMFLVEPEMKDNDANLLEVGI